MATLTSNYQYLGRSSVMTSKSGSLSYYILLYGKTVANQTTGIHTVTIKEVLASTQNTTYYYYTQAHNGKINGSTAFSGTNKPSTAWELSNFTAGGVTYRTGTLLGEGSVNVDCTNGLSKDITLSCYYAFNSAGDSYTPSSGTNRTVSVTATLSAIPRASVINSFRGSDIEGNFSVVYTSYSSSFTHKLKLILKAENYTLETFDNYVSGTDVYFSNENVNNLLGYMRHLPSVDISAVIETWSGSTKLGESAALTNSFSVDNALPIITASVAEQDDYLKSLTGDENVLIKYHNNAKATMSAEAQKGAVMDESLYIIRNGNNTGYGTTHFFENVESGEFIFTAEDSRGNVGRKTVTLPMVDYVKLTCNLASNRPDALGNMTVACTGNYFNDTFGAVSNTLTVQYRYAVSGGAFGEWADMSVTKSGNSYYASADFTIPDFDQSLFYSFETRAIDKLDTISSNASSVKSIPIFHWGENDFVFEVPVTFNAGTNVEIAEGDQKISGNLDVTGNLRLKGSGNYGNTLLFGDGTYCYITEPSDDVLHIKGAKGIHLISDEHGVYVDGNLIPIMQKGFWSPTLSSSAVSSYTTQYGWYSKMGQTVSVGFMIKAYCNSGWQSTSISISGLPFTPLFAAAGGGMCSGAYISGGYDFQCYVAETSGLITTRVQSCNNTSATNLSTSATGCNYRNGGGEITLSGTITFMSNT
jgi:hypothetical protein